MEPTLENARAAAMVHHCVLHNQPLNTQVRSDEELRQADGVWTNRLRVTVSCPWCKLHSVEAPAATEEATIEYTKDFLSTHSEERRAWLEGLENSLRTKAATQYNLIVVELSESPLGTL